MIWVFLGLVKKMIVNIGIVLFKSQLQPIKQNIPAILGSVLFPCVELRI